MRLVKLKHSGNAETYISEFLRLSVMVPDLPATRRVYMFIDGLDEPLHGLVKSTKPTTLQDAMKGLETFKMPFQKKRQHFNISPLFHQREKKRRLLLQKRVNIKNLLMMMSGKI